MNLNQVLVVCDDRDRQAAELLANQVADDWAGAEAPAWIFVTPDELASLGDQLCKYDAGWLYAGVTIEEHTAQQAIISLRQAQLPVLCSHLASSEPAGLCWQEGVMLGPPNTPIPQLRLALQALTSQSHTIHELRSELHLHVKSQHGLVDQIDKLDEELRLAARIQREFLPDAFPEMPRVSFAVLYRPAGYVSGDTYDVHQLTDSVVAFYVADAVGHGVPAALLTMLIKQSIRMPERRNDHSHIVSPADVLSRLNADLLRRTTGRVQFVTAAYGLLDTESGQLKLCCAGHPSPMLLKADGSIENLSPEGPLLGVFDEPEFDTLTMTIDPGDRLLIYSDGFELAFGDQVKAVNDRYIDELHALRIGDSGDALRKLEHELDQAHGSLHQRDDLTALLIDMTPREAQKTADDKRRRRQSNLSEAAG